MDSKLKIVKEVTPKKMSCAGIGCPSIFETNKNSYLLIGKKINADKLGIKNRLSKDEILIEVPKKIIDNRE